MDIADTAGNGIADTAGVQMRDTAEVAVAYWLWVKRDAILIQ